LLQDTLKDQPGCGRQAQLIPLSPQRRPGTTCPAFCFLTSTPFWCKRRQKTKRRRYEAAGFVAGSPKGSTSLPQAGEVNPPQIHLCFGTMLWTSEAGEQKRQWRRQDSELMPRSLPLVADHDVNDFAHCVSHSPSCASFLFFTITPLR
jgi:hypothetical protein